MTWDARHEEALEEFRRWDAARAASHMSASQLAKHAPRVRSGKLVGVRAKKSRRPVAPVAVVTQPALALRVCFCGKAFHGKTRDCRTCQLKRWRKRHPNATCATDGCDAPLTQMQRHCRACTRARRAATRAPCACGRPNFIGVLCKPCYSTARRERDPYFKAKDNKRSAVRLRKKYWADPVAARARWHARKHTRKTNHAAERLRWHARQAKKKAGQLVSAE